MNNHFRKKNRTRSEEMLRRVSFQNTLGVTGSELKKTTIITRDGGREDLFGEIKGIRVNEQGLPQVLTERYGTVLDCGHVAFSRSDFQGTCYMGHTVCEKENIYRCSLCGAPLCDIEVVWEDDEPVCPEHEDEIASMKIKMAAFGLLSNTLKTLFGVIDDEERYCG